MDFKGLYFFMQQENENLFEDSQQKEKLKSGKNTKDLVQVNDAEKTKA